MTMHLFRKERPPMSMYTYSIRKMKLLEEIIINLVNHVHKVKY